MEYLEEEFGGYEEEEEEEDIFERFIEAEREARKKERPGEEEETAEEILQKAGAVESGFATEEQEFAYSFQQMVSAKKSTGAVFVGRRRLVSDEERMSSEVRETLDSENAIIRVQPRDRTTITKKLEDAMPTSKFYNIPVYVRAFLFVQENGKEFTPEKFQDVLKKYRKHKKVMIAEDFLRYILLISQEQ